MNFSPLNIFESRCKDPDLYKEIIKDADPLGGQKEEDPEL
jgi:hypothetical protein